MTKTYEKIGRSKYGGLHLGRGWYLQFPRDNKRGLFLTTGSANVISLMWWKKPYWGAAPFGLRYNQWKLSTILYHRLRYR